MSKDQMELNITGRKKL